MDIGAHRPIKISNSFYFYIRGWHGITVEPQVDLYELHCNARHRDTQINVGIDLLAGEMDFYRMNYSTLSTFSKEEAERMANMPDHEILETIKVPVLPLSEVLSKYAGNTKIDFMSVDVEGKDMDVLKSNDWDRFRPTIVVVETSEYRVNDDIVIQNKNEFISYFDSIDYKPIWGNGLNTFFKYKDVIV